MSRHTPFEDVQQLVDSLQSGPEAPSRRLGDDLLDWTRRGTAPVDLVEHDDQFVAAFDVPGCTPEDVDVRIEGRDLVVDAEYESAIEDTEESDEGQYHHRQRRHEATTHSVTFPGEVRGEEASASLEHGVLTVTVPREHANGEGTHIDVE